MGEVLMYRLKMNRRDVLLDLEPDEILSYLYQEDVIDGDTKDEIQGERTRTKQAEALLSHVEGQGPAIQKLIEALDMTSQSHLARMLEEKLPDEETLSKGISQSFEDSSLCYPMTHNPSGYAVIINNFKFDVKTGLKVREGTDVDVERVKELFKYLQFRVDVHENKTALQIKHIVREYAVDKDHKNSDCFVLFLMSHGFSRGIYGTDGKVYLHDIKQFLKPDKCFGLSRKPKLIFIQACRGQNPDIGQVVTDSPSPVQNYSSTQEHAGNQTYTPSALDGGNRLPPIQFQWRYFPNEADFFIAFASSSSHAAFRNTITGGWFVSQLCDVFREYAEKEDLYTMILRVSDNVSKMKHCEYGEIQMQCPEQQTNLRKKLFFKPRKN